MVACLHDPAWISLCQREFEKSLSLGASGMLYDEAFHHYAAHPLFLRKARSSNPRDPGFRRLDSRSDLSGIVAATQSINFLLRRSTVRSAASALCAFLFPNFQGHIPAERYSDPYYPIMIAVTGFDDREMINRALLYRYIISYEPYNFKGDLDDFPLTMDYGKKIDAFRTRYSDYLWKGEFRDTMGAKVDTVFGAPISYSVFLHAKGKLRAVVLINDDRSAAHEATLALDRAGSLSFATPESPELQPCGPKSSFPPARRWWCLKRVSVSVSVSVSVGSMLRLPVGAMHRLICSWPKMIRDL